MHLTLVVTAFALTGFAAARSTWSPCGLSMLSSITPLGEQGRGHRFRSTAAWFVVGAVLGGATLGAVMAGLAAAVSAAGPSGQVVAGAGAVFCAVAAALDLGAFGPRIPLLRRQVNEVWLDRYRSWVYGAGFGWQIGFGYATFIMTAAVLALVPLAALTGAPLVALGVGVAFGGLRGLTVLMGRSIREPAALRTAHRRLDRFNAPVRLAVAAALSAAALGLAVAGGIWAGLAVAAVVVVSAGVAAAGGRILGARGAMTGDGSCALIENTVPGASGVSPAVAGGAVLPAAVVRGKPGAGSPGRDPGHVVTTA